MALAGQSADCSWSATGTEVMIQAPCLGCCEGSEGGNCRGMCWLTLSARCSLWNEHPRCHSNSPAHGDPSLHSDNSWPLPGWMCLLSLTGDVYKYLLGKGTSQGSSKFSCGSKTSFLPCVFPALILKTKDDKFWILLLHSNISYSVDKRFFLILFSVFPSNDSSCKEYG